MKKIMFGFVFGIILIISGALYGTHSLIIEETEAISLEQAYLAQYPASMPDVIIIPMVNIPF